MYKRILIPLDRSEIAESVLPLACTLARNNSADVILLHIVEYPFSLYPVCDVYPPIDPALRADIQGKKQDILQDGMKYLKRVLTYPDMIGIHAELQVRDGPVVETILSTAEERLADLLVISTHGCSGDLHGMIGAVANRVLREAKIPVILSRPIQAEALPDAFLRQRSLAIP